MLILCAIHFTKTDASLTTIMTTEGFDLANDRRTNTQSDPDVMLVRHAGADAYADDVASTTQVRSVLP
jgi:hypothetical protein